MYVTTELNRLRTISNPYSPTLWPFVVSYKFYYGLDNAEVAPFWTDTFGVTVPLTTRTIVTGVVYQNNINYAQKGSLQDCLLDDESYFWDSNDQRLYIHYNELHNIDYINLNFDTGVSIGLTNDKVRIFEDRIFYPYLLSFPQIETEVDKFNYDSLAFITDKLIFDNKSGYFNQFKDTPLYGNKAAIKTGTKDSDTYTDLVERATYFIDDYDFSADEFVVDIQDVRKTLTAQVPNKILSIADYPDLGDNSIGEVVPFGYGPLRDVPGLLINEEAISSSVYPQFLFLEKIVESAGITVWIKDNDDVWVEQTSGVSVDWDTGIVTVNGARTLSGSTYSAYPVKANLSGIQNTYGSDVIKDMNERFLGFSYDNSNYDTVTWEANQIYLSPISLYMDDTKDIYEWIKEVQSLSSVGFRYTNTPDNKRTILIDNPNKDVLFSIPKISIKNIADISAQSNKDDLYNKVYIGYNKSILNKTAPKVENISYYDESFDEYRVIKIYDKITGLQTEAEAINRAALQAEDYYKVRKVFECTLIGAQYLDLELYDIIEVELSLTKEEFVYTQVIQEVLSNADIMQEAITASEIQKEWLVPIALEQVGDEYFGIVRGQIVSKAPDYTLETNRVKIRQRPYSEIWESIYG